MCPEGGFRVDKSGGHTDDPFDVDDCDGDGGTEDVDDKLQH